MAVLGLAQNPAGAAPTYGGRPTRVDCAAAPNCTYAEELQNFANWYSYSSFRMNLMKTFTGRVFSAPTIDERCRVGFLTINASSTARYLPIAKFDATQKAAWFTKFYAMDASGGTPLRQALSIVGRHYAGVITGINSFMPQDPVQYSCQQNYALLTSDGYWNGTNDSQKLDGSAVGDQDNTDSGFSTRASGAYDGNLGGTAGSSAGSANTLADVAMYYYKTDLRTSGPVAKNNVPTTDKDTAAHQHMVTFTLGLGLEGQMTHRPDYETATAGDFYKIKTAAGGCAWTAGTCNWPQAQQNAPGALDDLWHAAVNGRGTFFSAKNPDALEVGLIGALDTLKSQTGAAAASATSTPNVTPTDNFIYSSTYRTTKWDGEVIAEQIDASTGNVIPGAIWSARAQLNAQVAANSDTRTIRTFSTIAPVTSTKLKPFTWANLDPATEQIYFANKCAALSQCGSLAPAQQTRANDGQNMVQYLRGWGQNEGTLYRSREFVLGDTVNAKPVYVKKPTFLFGDAVTPSYSDFAAANSNRQAVLYIAANDGMLHAFNADTGAELWAYVPRIVYPKMHLMATENYDIKHTFYVDGSPTSMDVFIGGAWKTILVGGLNAGGRGFYALDITDPATPRGMWEICSDSAQCAVSDSDLGLSFGNPVITKRPSDGKWVVLVTSGYNNVSPGNGQQYLYVLDAATGAILSKVGTGVGDPTTPGGLAKISGFAVNAAQNNTVTVVYGGDLLGNVWRFDMASVPPTVQRIGQLMDGAGKPQSVTTRPDITKFAAGFNVVYIGTGRLLGSSDLHDPATRAPPANLAYQQSVYAFKDTGADLGNLRLPAAKLQPQSLNVIDSVTRTTSSNAVDWSTKNGWFVDFNPANDSPGERVNIDPQLVKGVLIVATNEPNSEAYSSGGDSWLYQFNYKTGTYVASAPGNVAATKLGSALVAGFAVYRLGSGQLKVVGIDVTGRKIIGGVNPGSGDSSGKRVSWRELMQ